MVHRLPPAWTLLAGILGLACGSGAESRPPSTPPNLLAGIGDSIMQGFDADGLGVHLGDQVQYSFAQGTDSRMPSLFARYRDQGHLSQGEVFVSASGAEMVNGALAQAEAICGLPVKPDRIVVLLGGNDVCNRDTGRQLYSVAQFRSALKAALDALGAPACGLRAGSWVHVLSMPRVDLLRATGVQKDTEAGRSYCQGIWSTYSICRIVTRETEQSALDPIGAQIDAYNDGIRVEVDTANANHGGTEGIRFTTDWIGTTPNTSVGTVTFGPRDLSDLDCFHPSIAGQSKLACIAWETWELGGDVASCFAE